MGEQYVWVVMAIDEDDPNEMLKGVYSSEEKARFAMEMWFLELYNKDISKAEGDRITITKILIDDIPELEGSPNLLN
jgi:hypothetical protein